VDVGHAEFFHGVLDGLALPAHVKTDVEAALARRDFVALKALLVETELGSAEQDLLLRFPALRGGPEILEAAAELVRNGRSEQALRELRRVHELMGAHGLGHAVLFDLGAIRDFDYYTGVIFEGYGPDLGQPLAQGGRYDGLLARFGRPAPATGFMIHLDRVGEVLRRSGRAPELTHLDVGVAWTAAGLDAALRLGASLRMFGMRAVVDTEPRTLDLAIEWRQTLGARHLLHLDQPEWVAWAEDGDVRRLPAAQVVGHLAGEGVP
jgi:ATP phosphoribosyltransferase regulatory subunit